MANTLRYNNTIPGNIYYNNAKVQNVYYNNTKVWSSRPPVTGDLVVGNIVTFDNKTWRVVHNTGNQWYLGLSVVSLVEEIPFDENGGYYTVPSYSGSTLANKCASYLNNFSANAQSFMQNVTVNGVTAKVFVPSFEQVSGGFSYYNSNDNRICDYDQPNASKAYWWTSSPYLEDTGRSYCVDDIGMFEASYIWDNRGFRPHICIIY